jgi:hypothetical protein
MQQGTLFLLVYAVYQAQPVSQKNDENSRGNWSDVVLVQHGLRWYMMCTVRLDAEAIDETS